MLIHWGVSVLAFFCGECLCQIGGFVVNFFSQGSICMLQVIATTCIPVLLGAPITSLSEVQQPSNPLDIATCGQNSYWDIENAQCKPCVTCPMGMGSSVVSMQRLSQTVLYCVYWYFYYKLQLVFQLQGCRESLTMSELRKKATFIRCMQDTAKGYRGLFCHRYDHEAYFTKSQDLFCKLQIKRSC